MRAHNVSCLVRSLTIIQAQCARNISVSLAVSNSLTHTNTHTHKHTRGRSGLQLTVYRTGKKSELRFMSLLLSLSLSLSDNDYSRFAKRELKLN